MPVPLRKAAFWFMTLTAISYVFAYLRDAGIAALYGASRATDAFFVGTFPAMALYAVVIAGSFVPALLPALAEGETADGGRAIVGSVSRWLVAGLFAVVLAGEIFASSIVSLLAPGFDGASGAMASIYLRLSLPMLLFLGPAALAGAALNFRHNFVGPAFGSMAFSGTMLASLALAARWGLGVVAFAMVVGAGLQLVINLLVLPASYRRAVVGASVGYDSHAAGRVIRLAAPMLVYMALTQALPMLERLLASSLNGGVLSDMAYATKLYLLPVTVIATSYTTIMFTSLTRHAASDDMARLLSSLRQGLAHLTLLTAPIAAWLWACAPLIVSLVFGHGSFSRPDIYATAQLLGIYAVGLAPLSLIALLVRAFYALKQTNAPLMAGAATVGLYLALGVPMKDHWGAQGLAWAMALTSVACMLLLLTFLFGSSVIERVGRVGVRDIFLDNAQPLVAASCSGALMWVVKGVWLHGELPEGWSAQAGALAALTMVGAVAYLGLTALFGVLSGGGLRGKNTRIGLYRKSEITNGT